ncbi:hypothetical protein QR680_006300 [Steinernema hermaphroditum]|uniref:Anaphase-promoting complex subunit 4 WD40 domain-containing protein n=1 Tax=Steinernema hermaphroditum TaxID=289476 RepID=A0AA39LWB4_9BILA|nr:hypothetical protein QR680_006300 [Steinernema hermaphroditum]
MSHTVSFNFNASCLACGEDDGFTVYRINNDRQNLLEKFVDVRTEEKPRLIEHLHRTRFVLSVSEKRPKELAAMVLGKQVTTISSVPQQTSSQNQVIDTLKNPSDILSVRVNSKRFIVCLKDMIKVYVTMNMTNIHVIKDLPETSSGTVDMAASDNSIIAYPSSSETGTITLFDGIGLKKMMTIEAHNGPIAALKFNKTAEFLATASDKGTVIRLFSVQTGERLCEFSRGVTRYATIFSLAFSEDSSFLASTSNTGTVHLFKLEHTRPEKEESEAQESYFSYYTRFFRKQAEIYAPAAVRPKSSADCSLPVSSESRSVCALRMIEDQLHLLVLTCDGYFFVYEYNDELSSLTLATQRRLGGEEEEADDDKGFNPKGDSLSFGDSNGYMVYDINGYAQPELRLAYKKDFVRDISVIERLHHALLLFVVSKLHPKIVRVFDLRNGEVHQLQGFSSDVFSVRASFNLVIVCTADTIRLYVTKNMTLKHAITDIPNPKGLVDMTPLDKKALIAFPCCDVTGRVALFDGLHLKEMRPIEAHNGPIAALKFSPSGDLLATASDKGTVIRLFDVDTGTRVFEFSRGFVRYAHIHCLSFSADSRYLASTSSTGTLHLYELDSRFREMGNTEREESLISSYTNYFWKQTEHYMPAVVRPKSIASASLFTSQDAASICTFRAVDGKQFVLVASTDGYFFVYEFTEGSPVLTLLQQWRIGDKGGEKNDFADVLCPFGTH